MREFKELWLPPIIFFTVLIGGSFVAVTGLDQYNCQGYSTATGKPTKYLAMECYIKDGGEWYAWNEYKYRLAARGQMKQL